MSLAADHNELLAAYGRSVGVEGVAFDDGGEARLAFDGIVIRFVHDAARQQILLTSPVFGGVIVPDIDVYASLLELNLGGILHGAGAVGLDKDTGTVTFSNAVSLVGLDQARFNTFVASGVDLVEAWRELVESESFPRKIETPSASPPPGEEGATAIRV